MRNERRKIYNLLRSASILGSDVCWEPQTFGSGVCGMMWIGRDKVRFTFQVSGWITEEMEIIEYLDLGDELIVASMLGRISIYP